MKVGENPIPILTIKQIQNEQDKETFKKTYLGGVNFIDDDYNKSFVENRYPESDTQVFERAARARFHMVSHYKNSDESVLHLVVTHGTLIRFWSQSANMRVKKVKYCGLSAQAIKPSASDL